MRQAYAICHGVTVKSSVTTNELALGVHDGHARLVSYQFHPVSDKSGKVNREIHSGIYSQKRAVQ